MKGTSWATAYQTTRSRKLNIAPLFFKNGWSNWQLVKISTPICFNSYNNFSIVSNTQHWLLYPSRKQQRDTCLFTSLPVKVSTWASHWQTTACRHCVCLWLTNKVVRASSSTLLRQLVNTEVSQFICHVIGCRVTSICALHAAKVVCGVYVCGLKVLGDKAESYRGGRRIRILQNLDCQIILP